MKKLIIPCLALSLCWSCNNSKNVQQQADAYIKEYTQQYQQLYTQATEAEWASNTRIIEGDSTNAIATRKANEAMAAFTGSEENIRKTRELLAQKKP